MPRDDDREQPHAEEAEKIILGTIMAHNHTISEAIDMLTVDDFYTAGHRLIFSAMLDLFREGQELGWVIVAEGLRKNAALEKVGGRSFLIELTIGVPDLSIARYAKTVKAMSLRRATLREVEKIKEAAYDEDDADAMLDNAQAAILSLTHTTEARAIMSDRQVAALTRTRLESMRPGPDSIDPAIPTPWSHLNGACRGGIHDTELWGLSAVIKNGKSVFVKQWAQFLQARGTRALYFSREMSEVQIMYRMLAPLTEIPVSHIRYGIDENRINRLISATHQVEPGHLFFDTKSSTVTDVRTRVREMIRLEKVEIVFIDYLQCFSSGRRSYGRADEVGPVWRGMKDIAQDFNTRVVAVAQFNRTAFQNERPRFHQTEGSGEAEKAVSVGLVLSTDFEKGESGARPAAFYIDYQRDEAPGGQVDLIFDGRIMEFHQPQADVPYQNEDWNQ